jgi:hypothetical protein
MSLLTVALVAVASSLATVGAIEFLRGLESNPAQVRAVEPRAEGGADPRGSLRRPLESPSRAPVRTPTGEDRLANFERRLSDLEQWSNSPRTPLDDSADFGEGGRKKALRALVLGWVEEDREFRRLSEEQQAAENRRKEREFSTRMEAHFLALEHGLLEWEQELLAGVLFEIETRREEVEGAIDPRKDDPAEAEQRFVEFDEWANQRLQDELGLELYERIFGAE